MRLTSFFPILLSVLAVSACGGGGGGDSAPGNAREFSRMDSPVTVVPGGAGGSNRYTASQTVTISNDSGGATAATVHLSDDVGSVTSSAGTTSYQIQITLSAEGGSEAEARQALSTISVSHRDALAGGTLYLDNAVKFAQYNASNSNRTATVAASLPATLDYSLGQATGVGSVSTSGLGGPVAELSSDVGSVSLSGNFDRATGDSGSGAVDITVSKAPGAVYDLIADTGVGTATITVAGTTPNGNQTATHSHFTSVNYSSGSPQVSVAASSGVGSANIHD